jgi:hypothetical protein
MADNKNGKSLLNVARFSLKKQQDRINSGEIKKLREQLFVSEHHTLDFKADLVKEIESIDDLNLLVNLRNFFKFESDMLEKGLYKDASGDKILHFFKQLDERYKFYKFKDDLSFNWQLTDESTGTVHNLETIKDLDEKNVAASLNDLDNKFKQSAPDEEFINYGQHKKKGWKKNN